MTSPIRSRPTGKDTRRGYLTDRNLLALILILLAALGWSLMFFGHAWHGGLSYPAPNEYPTPNEPPPPNERPAVDEGGGEHQHHHSDGNAEDDASASAADGVLIAAGGWAVMVVAMMVPPALPMFQMLLRLVSSRRGRMGLVALALLVFTAMWTVLGIVLLGGSALLQWAMTAQPWLAENSRLIAGAVLIGAGVYQFTPLKNSCLRACRSPRGFALAHWRGQRPAAVETTILTGAYTLSCIGCCWALMAICLVVGTAALPAMVAIAVVMAAERLVPWGRSLARPVGVATAAAGLALATGLVPAQLLTG